MGPYLVCLLLCALSELLWLLISHWLLRSRFWTSQSQFCLYCKTAKLGDSIMSSAQQRGVVVMALANDSLVHQGYGDVEAEIENIQSEIVLVQDAWQ
jgi:hypothetical protein